MDFDEFIAVLGPALIDPDEEEMTTVFQEAGFKGAGVDARFFGETHDPHGPHVFSSFIELESEDGATSALGWLETDAMKPCPNSCATRVSSFGATRALQLPGPVVGARSKERLEGVGTDPDSLLFTSSQGHPIRHRNFLRRVWHPTLAELGLPLVGMHTMRHSAVARMIGAKWQAIDVQRTLGHRSAGFTLTVYGHLFDEHLDDLAAALESPRRRTGNVQSAIPR